MDNKTEKTVSSVIDGLVNKFHETEPNISVSTAKSLAICALSYFDSDVLDRWKEKKFTRRDMIDFKKYLTEKDKKNGWRGWYSKSGEFFTYEELLNEFEAELRINLVHRAIASGEIKQPI